MILQALKEYYDRMASDEKSGIAPLGWEWKEIPFFIVLNNNGELDHIEDESYTPKRYLVPQGIKRTGKNFAANLLWDKTEYVLGLSENMTDDIKQKHENFINRLDEYVCIPEIQIIKFFLENNIQLCRLQQETSWDKFHTGSVLASFRIVEQNKPIFENNKFSIRLFVDYVNGPVPI